MKNEMIDKIGGKPRMILERLNESENLLSENAKLKSEIEGSKRLLKKYEDDLSFYDKTGVVRCTDDCTKVKQLSKEIRRQVDLIHQTKDERKRWRKTAKSVKGYLTNMEEEINKYFKVLLRIAESLEKREIKTYEDILVHMAELQDGRSDDGRVRIYSHRNRGLIVFNSYMGELDAIISEEIESLSPGNYPKA